MRDGGRLVHLPERSETRNAGTSMPPAMVEIEQLSDLRRKIPDPVLRYKRQSLEALLEELASIGCALTVGALTRPNEIVARVSAQAIAGTSMLTVTWSKLASACSHLADAVFPGPARSWADR